MKKPKVIKLKKGILVCGDAAKMLPKNVPDESVDLVLTSPPYDQQRTYRGYTFDFQNIARQCARVLKPGGVIVWVVADATVNGSETGTSFRQALYFKDECGLNLHDTMLFVKNNPVPGDHGPRYRGCFEYMFALSKGIPKTFNPIELKPTEGSKITAKFRLEKDGRKPFWENEVLGDKNKHKVYVDEVYARTHSNLFFYTVGQNKAKSGHTAVFPEQLAEDMIRTWTNPGDVVLDPFSGSGTTARMAAILDRRYIAIEISQEYLEGSIPLIEKSENFEPVFAEEAHRFEKIELDFN